MRAAAEFTAEPFKEQVYSLVSYPQAALAFIQEAEQYIKMMDDTLKPLYEKIDVTANTLNTLPYHPFMNNCLQAIIEQMSIGQSHPKTFVKEAKTNVLALTKQLKDVASFNDLLQLEKQTTVSYPLLVEFIEQRLQHYVTHIQHIAKTQSTVDQCIIWYTKTLKTFETNTDEALCYNWTTQLIDKDIYEQWLVDLTTIFEEKFDLYEPLLRDVLNGQLSFSTFETLDSILQQYIQQIYVLFLTERWQLHQKFAFQLGGEVQEKLEMQSRMYQLVTPIIENIHVLMKDCSDSEQQSIMKMLHPILALPIQQLDHLVADYSFVEDILNEFHLLKRTQFEIFSKDTHDFVLQQQQRDAAYNALMYKMRKQLLQQTNY